MPTWLMVNGRATGVALGAGSTNYMALAGRGDLNVGGDLVVQILARDSYTLSKLTIRVTANATAANSTVTSRINAAPGGQTITIGAGATGIFEDAVNSDALVTGDLFNARVVVGAGGALTVTMVGCVLTAAVNNTPILATTGYVAHNGNITRYYCIGGRLVSSGAEVGAQYRFRVGSTLSNLAVYLASNTLAVATTITTRINAAPGAQTIIIGAGATGRFEDAVNTDAVAVTDLVNYSVSIPVSAGAIENYLVQTKSDCLGRQLITSNVGGGTTLPGGITRYFPIEGMSQDWTANEPDIQMDAQATFQLRNLFVYIGGNSLVGNSTIGVRKNTGPGNITVTIGAGATGIFEDNANSDDFVDGDLLNYEIVTAVGAGQIQPNIIGVTQYQSAVAVQRPYNMGRIAAMMR